LDETSCIALGGTFENACTFPDLQTEETCLSGLNCVDNDSPWKCSRTVCADITIVNQANCTTDGLYWDGSLSLCVSNRWDISYSECIADGYTFMPSKYYQKGRYDTVEKCPAQTCDYWDVLMKEGTEEDCLASGYCTSPCQRCLSYSFPNGLCIVNAPSEEQCLGTTNGIWQNGRCISQNQEANECTLENETWLNCDDSTTRDTCEADSNPAKGTLGCYWNDWAPCLNSESCTRSGMCDDWEFQNGACVYTPNEPRNCGNSGWATRSGLCINSQVYSKEQCPEYMEWITRATSRETCEDFGNECIFDDGYRNNMDIETCTDCGADSRPVYKWSFVLHILT
jgi:hypothetical protein